MQISLNIEWCLIYTVSFSTHVNPLGEESILGVSGGHGERDQNDLEGVS